MSWKILDELLNFVESCVIYISLKTSMPNEVSDMHLKSIYKVLLSDMYYLPHMEYMWFKVYKYTKIAKVFGLIENFFIISRN